MFLSIRVRSFSLAQGDSLRSHRAPGPPMEPDISTLHKPDILILRRHVRVRSLFVSVRGRQVFSPDGRRVYYMVDRRPQGPASELWSTEIGTGKSQVVVSEAGLFGFDIWP